ncbi:glycosyl transferase family protein [Biformimicrobium ophioploci]|uniref:Cyclic di-3',5'-guanylate-activated glycosyltransferase NrfB n=1 Tax=Biformimicrobium ophioploci TaxID=3036711 RepID=A0ABQ6LXM4_9GAMM|nr:glycosyl transferase family protein [Microbulbifer sp. NKW57]GMG86782.1 cyclic di-3',5'-guanylate-activated glycosyltransferase NrfB [Microbulbifer sp. NKW57]
MPDYAAWIATYYFALKYIFIVVAVVMLAFGIDDLFIDLVYWWDRIKTRVFKCNSDLYIDTPEDFPSKKEKPLAIMVPAWMEAGVIGKMAELMAGSIDYENYQIFVGTYPNDLDTQAEVDRVVLRHPNVHKVVCGHPGPTCKSDCLNNILEAISSFETEAKVQFAGYILHDSEDVIDPLELRLFNFHLDNYGFIQIPVYPFARRWNELTAGHYLDEFAELHTKDVPVRKMLSGQVPSAGVGTCFRRDAINKLAESSDNLVFNTDSLTEDYDIAFRLHELGTKQVFLRCPSPSAVSTDNVGWDDNARKTICIREYFPETLSTAIRQKSRWITGIIFQGYRSIGWKSRAILNYFLWRDRRGAITNIWGFTGLFILFNLSILWVYEWIFPNGYRFLTDFSSDPIIKGLVYANLTFLVSRLFHRAYFTGKYYGKTQAILSIPRVIWSNLINFCACIRAISQVLSTGDARRVRWDKTTHIFPEVSERIVGDNALAELIPGYEDTWERDWKAHDSMEMTFLQYLIFSGKTTSLEIAQLRARNAKVEVVDFSLNDIYDTSTESIPSYLAIKYSVVCLEASPSELILASEHELCPATLAIISRKTKRQVRYKITKPGKVTTAILHLYSGNSEFSADILRIPDEQLYLTCSFKEYLIRFKKIHPSIIAQATAEIDSNNQDIGKILVSKNVLSSSELTFEQFKYNSINLPGKKEEAERTHDYA